MTGTVALEGFHCVKHALRFAPTSSSRSGCATVSAPGRSPSAWHPTSPRRCSTGPSSPTSPTTRAWRAPDGRPDPDRCGAARRARAPLVLLDRPRSPGNAGAVVRVAAAAGASGVATTGPLDPWHPTVLRGSAGLHYALPVLHLAAGELPAGPYAVLDAGGDPDAVLPAAAVLVVGTERDGVGDALRERADLVLALPMRPGVSSLNLATATAAALYRRR